MRVDKLLLTIGRKLVTLGPVLAPQPGHRVGQVLLVVLDAAERAGLSRHFPSLGSRVAVVGSAQEALRILPASFELLLIDGLVVLDQSLSIIDAAFRQSVSPVVALMGPVRDPKDAFELARAGVQIWLPKPVSLDEIERQLRDPRLHLRPFESVLRALGGRLPLKDLQRHLRELVVHDALLRARGSRRAAARQLGVTRTAVQKVSRQFRFETRET